MLLMTLLVHGVNNITIYYNGTVIYNVVNVSEIELIGTNISNLEITGSNYIIEGKEIFLKNPNIPTTIKYTSYLGDEIRLYENFTSLIEVILPSSYNIYYLTPVPVNFSVFEGRYLIILFNTSNLTILYGINPINHTINYGYYLLLGALFLSIGVTLFLLYLVIKTRRKEIFTKVEPIIQDSETLDERDQIILKSIKEGVNTIAKISQMTGIPKATVYRRLKRLEKMGYVKEVRMRGKVIYELNSNKNEGNPETKS